MKVICPIALLVLYSAIGISQYELSFTHMNTQNCGLTTDHVNSVYEDNEGVIWFATANGLNRFDGKNCEYFLSDIHDPNSLASNYTDRIVQDNRGRYWITGKNGITIYDPSQATGHEFRKFSCYETATNPFPICRVLDIVKDNDGHLWCSPSDSYFIRIDPEHDTFETIPTPSRILWLYFDKTTSTIAAGSIDKGFYEIDTKSCVLTDHEAEFKSQLHRLPIQDTVYPYLGMFPVTNIVKDEKGNWWMSSTGSRLYRYNPTTHILDLFAPTPVVYMDDYVKSMVLDKHGTIWAGTSGHGIFTFNTHTQEFTFLTANPSNPNGLINSGIISIDQDSYGSIWISTLTGVQKHDPAENKTQYISPLLKQIVPSNRDIGYTSLFEDDDGLIWYGSHSGAFTGYSDSKELTPIPALNRIVIYGIVRASPRLMLFGTLAGVLEYDLITQKAKNLSIVGLKQNVLNHFFTTDVTKLLSDTIDGKPYVWIGTNCEGLFLYCLGTRQLFVIPGIQCAYDLEEDQEGKLWIGSANAGVYCIPDKREGYRNSFLQYTVQSHALNSNFVNDIMVDNQNAIWVLTEGGINIIREGMVSEFKDINDKIDPVLHLEQDNFGDIWFMSKKRLFRYDIQTKEISQFNSSRTLSVSYGDYVWMYKMKSGKIFTPSENKWTVIQPENFTDEKVKPQTILTDIDINGENRLDLKYQDPARLSYQQHSFEFGFAAHPYTNSKLIHFEWSMEGLNESWTPVPLSSNKVNITNLAPGDYIFKVRACSSQGIWDTEGTTFPFKILPPWWQTWWFRSILLLVFGSLAYYIFRQRTQKLLAIQRIEIEKTLALDAERSRISRDMHDDLGSGLSAIHLLSNYLSEHTAEKYPEFSTEIDKIRKSSEDLNESIREIIWTVNTKDDNLTALVLFIRRYGHELQDKTKTNIHIHSEDPVPDIQLNGVQRKHVFLCVKEALNNALKHGKPTDINLYISSDAEKKIAIRVADNGGGFSKRDPIFTSTGNGLRNMKERMNDIGGVIEIESDSQGTEVKFTFNA